MIFINIGHLQKLFGENWEIAVTAILFIAGQVIWRILRKNRKKEDWLTNAQKRQKTRFDYLNPHASAPRPKEPKEAPPIYHAQHGEWSPTGWIYDADQKKWIPPDYLTSESQNRWTWDQEKRIWIDSKKAPRKEPDPNCPVKLTRNGLSYEEWKNQHYKEVYEKLAEEAEKRKQERENPRD